MTTAENYAIATVWVVTTNRNSWGKGFTYHEAFDRAMLNAGTWLGAPTEMHVYAFDVPENTFEGPVLKKITKWDAWKSVTVDDMGSVSYPQAARMFKLTRQPIDPALVKAWRGFREALEFSVDLPAWHDAFDDTTGLAS